MIEKSLRIESLQIRPFQTICEQDNPAFDDNVGLLVERAGSAANEKVIRTGDGVSR